MSETERRAFFAAHSPITFEVALNLWGGGDVNLCDDKTRAAFFAVWAMARGEMANAMVTEHEEYLGKDRFFPEVISL